MPVNTHARSMGCRAHGLPVGGKKADLEARVLAALGVVAAGAGGG
jgi:hypothetical protein